MARLIWTVLASFAAALVLGPVVIPWLKRMKFGQNVYELGPASHKSKQGVPTMGGVIFALPMLAVPLLFAMPDSRWSFLVVTLLCMVGFGLVGFVDDMLKIKKKRSLGLTPKQKLIPQIVLALLLSYFAYRNPLIGDGFIVPFTGAELHLGRLYIPVMAFILVATVNSANLLDGLDGLCAGCSMIDFGTLTLILMALAPAADAAVQGELLSMALFCGAAAGALLGFLRFNTHPASVIMGDVGSFAIGGALAGACMATRLSLLLPIIAAAMVVSSLSDIIQVAYFSATKGKRVFRMAPLHHHFELCGVPETRIVAMYQIGTALLCLIALGAFLQ